MKWFQKMFGMTQVIELVKDEKYQVDRALLLAQSELEYWQARVPMLEKRQKRLKSVLEESDVNSNVARLRERDFIARQSQP
jgi:hypothetical protein